ncbi:methyl-accepting chemotaxis protein [Methylobacterium gregans]|uniref:Methyl-accepting chemotaxis sensory transducer n=1 Tax=Methylobacterium gregans TaxID=374424 RepID=A0AA37HP54_9HYPH|nr:HAMP domain-containing methyl-accepting chemotaxis protein [Methylobacterium gregans]MDQ0523081.1 methyl-accepting chemotaxis protein [Methylobacterium gregans]GJD78568.1 hypothetical protein NBEOAGPD_1785 [Methylobacterium gregans]GLS56407.1 hypothetical protein GCM10007886_45920 [Methylobacterium gregans]
MRALNDRSFLFKLSLPFALVLLVGAGLILYAQDVMQRISARTAGLIDVQVTRQDSLARIRFGLAEAAAMDRNMLLEADPRKQARFKGPQEAAMRAASGAVETLLAMSDTPDRREMNLTVQRDIDAFFAVLRRTTALGLEGRRDEAFQIARDVGMVNRHKLNAWLEEREAHVAKELQAAKLRTADEVHEATRTLIVSGLAGLALIVALSAAIVVLAIARPLARLVAVLRRMAAGEIDAEIAEARRGDEIGAVGKAVEGIKAMVAQKAAEQAEIKRIADAAAAAERQRTMVELADGFERAVGGIVGMVSSSATELQATAQQMTSTANETANRSNTVAAAAGQAASNVQTVAAAAEELGSSVQEIGRQVAGSAGLARSAVGEAEQTAELVNALSRAAGRIGDVIGLISTIAGQTNLLALNATIEAARAGEAGRGFAVVASEVKDLASQTARATEEIATQIQRIQGSTHEAVQAIEGISGRIREIDAVAAQIAAAVEQQGAATQEIVRNVAQASMGTGEVTANIAGVAGAVEETGAAAAQVLTSASELSRQSEHLGVEVERFLATVRAA